MARRAGASTPPPELRPGVGRRLPKGLAPSGAARAAAAIPDGVRDPRFAALVERIDDDVFYGRCSVDVYFAGTEAFDAMVAAVDGAREEVLLESYIFKDDPTGRRFQGALIRAARRGVRVRVLADGIGSFETRREFWDELTSGGVEARLFRPLGDPLRLLKMRDHRKILVADRRTAFTGGMNIGDEYGSSPLPRKGRWRDTHARVEGSAVCEMAIVFEEAWRESGGSALGIEGPSAPGSGDPRVLVLDSRPGRGQREVSSAFAAITGAARRTLWITVAYFAPRTRGLRLLAAAARRGVDVRLLLPARTDVGLVRHAGHGFFSGLLRRGLRIFEYQPAVLHAKTLVVDGYLSVIGSSNLDFRSFELNAECNFLVLDAAVARRMEAQFEDDLGHAKEIHLEPWRRRGALHRLGDHLARRLAPFL